MTTNHHWRRFPTFPTKDLVRRDLVGLSTVRMDLVLLNILWPRSVASWLPIWKNGKKMGNPGLLIVAQTWRYRTTTCIRWIAVLSEKNVKSCLGITPCHYIESWGALSFGRAIHLWQYGEATDTNGGCILEWGLVIILKNNFVRLEQKTHSYKL